MKAGWRTSEFWLASGWLLLTVGGLFALAFSSWPIALCIAPGWAVLVWMAAVVTNNFGENRFLLKAGRQVGAGGEDHRQSFGFRSMAVQQDEADEDEEEDEE